jgi:two-component system CheB/CheR fusion protein
MIKESSSFEDFSDAFLGRLRAMAATHDVLSRGNWVGTGLKPLAETILQTLVGTGRHPVDLRGPELVLTPNAAATLGLVFYELATNASKYGGLAAGGHVELSWRIEPDPNPAVVIEWAEMGGPPIAGPLQDGFGIRFIKRSVEYELGGKADPQLGPTGLRWVLTFPVQRNIQMQTSKS